MNLCKDCKFFEGTVRGEWYDQFCGATPLPPRINTVTGKNGENTHAYCRDVNKGNCKKFVRV